MTCVCVYSLKKTGSHFNIMSKPTIIPSMQVYNISAVTSKDKIQAGRSTHCSMW